LEFKKKHKKIIYKLEDFLNKYDFYLAGGTAIYYYLKHRESEDLDFFTNLEIDFIREANLFKNYKVSLIKSDTLYLIIDNIKISFFYYPYSLLFPKHKINNISVADLKDILLMKILAIIQRGNKKDFIDVYFILKNLELNKEDLFDLFIKKFGEYNKLIINKALLYFDGAENEIMPEMIKKVEWSDIKKYFLKEFVKI